LSTAGAETSAPAEADLVPAQMQLEVAEAPQVSAEAPQLSPEAPPASAEVPLVSAEAPQVLAEVHLVPEETPLMSVRARPADIAHERTPSAEDPGPVLPSEWKAGATAVCAGVTRPVETAEALTSLRSRAGMPAGVGEEPRKPQGAAPSPPMKRCNMAGQGGWRDQLSRRNPGLELKEFPELPPAARLNLVRECGLCRLCLSRCDPEGKFMHKRCRWKSRVQI
jgi:hypothetical protein